jgi:hypothetical protein
LRREHERLRAIAPYLAEGPDDVAVATDLKALQTERWPRDVTAELLQPITLTLGNHRRRVERKAVRVLDEEWRDALA